MALRDSFVVSSVDFYVVALILPTLQTHNNDVPDIHMYTTVVVRTTYANIVSIYLCLFCLDVPHV